MAPKSRKSYIPLRFFGVKPATGRSHANRRVLERSQTLKNEDFQIRAVCFHQKKQGPKNFYLNLNLKIKKKKGLGSGFHSGWILVLILVFILVFILV